MKFSGRSLISDENKKIRLIFLMETYNEPAHVVFGIYRTCVKSLIKRALSAT